MQNNSFHNRAALEGIQTSILQLCLDKFAIRIVSPDADLFATGVLDSMTLVQLVLEMEAAFEITLPMHDIDIEAFRSVEKIAELVAANKSRMVAGAC